MLNAIVIDDVENARKTLIQDLQDYCPDVIIAGEAEGVISGAKLIKEVKPDLVFLDIQMNDGSGFDLLEILPEINFKLIFTTGSDAYAIKAFRFSAVDYLLKPIDPDQLQQAVNKTSAGTEINFKTLKKNLADGHHILALNSQEKINVVKVNEIVRCEASGSYTLFFMNDGEQILVTRTLKEFDSILGESGFIRVHQSHLVNIDFVREFVKKDGGYLLLNDQNEIPVSSRKRAYLIATLTEFTGK